MLDSYLRPLKDRLAEPIARVMPPMVTPTALTGVSLVAGLGAGASASQEYFLVALVLWWLSRIADGLDGPLARLRGTSSDLGGYLDQLADTVVYAAVPLGLAFAIDERTTWIACSVLLATFYLNTVSWAYLSALLEKRRAAQRSGRSPTSITMPSGLVEGAETIVIYTVMLAAPSWRPELMWVMACLVGATVVQRVFRARSLLSQPRSVSS